MKLFVSLLVTALFLVSCVDKASVEKVLKENPEIITNVIKDNPSMFIEALNEAVKVAQADQRKKAQEAEEKQLEDSFDNPLVPNLRKDDIYRGKKGAPLTLVEYSDFECPFCARGYQTVLQLLKKYEGKIQFVYKHLPLSFHPNAMPASQYYEALRIQNEEWAVKFHDELYENAKKIKNGEAYFKEVAKKLGANMSKLAKDVKSAEVEKRIKEDIAEASKFGFSGTPGFLINGIPVKGAYPATHFDDIISKLKEKGKVSL